MANLSWSGQDYTCAANPSQNKKKGWYYNGSYTGINTYINPATGSAYTIADFAGNGGASPSAPTNSPSGTGYSVPSANTGQIVTISPEDYLDRLNMEHTSENIEWASVQLGRTEDKFQNQLDIYGYLPDYPDETPPDYQHNIPGQPGQPGQGGMPTFEQTMQQVNLPNAPQYQPSAGQEQMQDLLSGTLTDIIEQGGIGIPEETQNLMIQQQIQTVKAQESSAIASLNDYMEARGLTNSGLAVSEMMNIKASSTRAIADSMTDIQIQSSLMKLSSFQSAIGQASQLLSYMGEESWKKYQSQVNEWDAQLSFYQQAIEHYYGLQDMEMTYYYQSQLNQAQNQFELQLQQMEIDAMADAAKQEGMGNIFGILFGTLLPLIFGL